MPVDLKVPTVGESVTEVQIGQWLKKEGDFVEKDEPLVEIESDKVTLELPAPVSGTISKIGKQSGDEAQVGDVIGQMEEGEAGQAKTESSDSEGAASHAKTSGASEKPGPDAKAARAEEKVADKEKADPNTPGGKEPAGKKPVENKAPDSQESSEGAAGTVHVMPSAQRLLTEHHLHARDVTGSGPSGRVLKEDVLRYLEEREKYAAKEHEEHEERLPEAMVQEEAGSRSEEVVPMSPLRRRIAQRLVEAQQTGALLTTFNEVDMSAVMAMRSKYQPQFQEKYGIKLGFMSFFTKAVIEGLKAFPAINAEVRDTDVVYRNYYDIGIAIGGGKGLVVPILRNAERMSFAEVEQNIAELAKRARDNKLKLEELTGGTFTITNGGIYGSLLSTPIVNPPQSGVLGMHSIQKRPVVVDDRIEIRPMMYLALTYDHRLVDGREAVSFLVRVKDCIEDPSRVLIEV